MSVSVDKIAAEFIATVDGYERDVKRAVAVVDSHTAAVERNNRAEAKAETETSATRKRRTSAEVQAAREQATIQKQAAKEIADAEKAAAKAASDAVKASTREQAAAVKSAEREKQAAIRETERVAKQAAATVGRDGLPVGPGVRPIKITEPTTPRVTQAEYEAAEARRAALLASLPERPISATQSSAIPRPPVAEEREINHALADRATYQAGLVASTREETVLIRDQITQLNLVAQYKRAGLTETEAAIKAEEVLVGVETRRAARAAETAAIQQKALEKQLTKQSKDVAGKVSLFIPALVGGVGVHELSEINDEYIRFSNSLKVAGVSALSFSDVQDHLLRTSTRTGAEIGSLADTYRSIALASHDLGATQGDILKVTDAVANSLRITGASGGAANAAILQLGHAFETGKVTAREFNGLALNAYPILQAAAAGSDKYGGSVAKLRAALIAGDLSSKEFFDAILKGSDALEGRANKAALTTAQGFTALRNALVVYVGSADQANGVSAALGAGLQKIAQNLDIVIPAIAAIGTALTVGYISRAIAATAATEGLGAALLGAFGGPIGIAITALTLTIGGFYTEIARHDAVIAQVNASFDEMRQRLRDAGDSAGLAASQTVGVGTAAQSAVPGVEILTGKVRSLANELFRQADAAKKARIETAAKAVADADRQERAAQAELPAARDNADGVRPGGLFNFRNYGRFFRSAIGGANNLFNDGAPDAAAKDAYRKAVAVSQQARRDLAAAYQGANGGPADTPTDPKTVRALAGLKTKLDGLETLAGGATGKRLDRIKSQIESTKQKITDIEAGASPAAANAAEGGGSGRGRRGPSAETLARREEAARLKGVRGSEGYTSALKRAHDQELQASIDLSNDAVDRARLERQRVRDAAAELADNIRAKGPKDPRLNNGIAGTGERSADDTATLLAINERIADLRVGAIDQAERRRNAEDNRSLDRAVLENRREVLQSQEQEADTLEERRRLAKQILDIDYQLKEAELRAVGAADSKATDAEKTIALRSLDALGARKSADEKGIDRQYGGAGASYLDGLKVDKKQFFEGEQVKLLQDFNSGLDDSIAKALHLHGIFGTIIGDLIDMAIKQAIIKPIANALFGESGSSGGGGGVGGIFGTILGAIGIGGPSTAAKNAAGFSLPGFALGGSAIIGGNPGVDQNVLSMNGQPSLRVGRGEMLTVSPNVAASNGRVNAAQPNVTVLQPIHADFTGARTDEQTMREFTRYADARSKQAYDAAVATAGAQAPGILQRKQTLGN